MILTNIKETLREVVKFNHQKHLSSAGNRFWFWVKEEKHISFEAADDPGRFTLLSSASVPLKWTQLTQSERILVLLACWCKQDSDCGLQFVLLIIDLDLRVVFFFFTLIILSTLEDACLQNVNLVCFKPLNEGQCFHFSGDDSLFLWFFYWSLKKKRILRVFIESSTWVFVSLTAPTLEQKSWKYLNFKDFIFYKVTVIQCF